jgi:AraC-like DNA-binding protein
MIKPNPVSDIRSPLGGIQDYQSNRKPAHRKAFKIHVKNMVCPCCEMYVKATLAQMGLHPLQINAGEIILDAQPSPENLAALDVSLKLMQMELLEEPKDVIVELIKTLVRELINKNEDPLRINLSAYLSERLNYNYSYLSNVFSKSEGFTIRDFGIRLRIDRVKTMLSFENLDLLEISVLLRYSSAAHLAAQFKKITGMTTTEFKRWFSESSGVLAPPCHSGDA